MIGSVLHQQWRACRVTLSGNTFFVSLFISQARFLSHRNCQPAILASHYLAEGFCDTVIGLFCNGKLRVLEYLMLWRQAFSQRWFSSAKFRDCQVKQSEPGEAYTGGYCHQASSSRAPAKDRQSNQERPAWNGLAWGVWRRPAWRPKNFGLVFFSFAKDSVFFVLSWCLFRFFSLLVSSR